MPAGFLHVGGVLVEALNEKAFIESQGWRPLSVPAMEVNDEAPLHPG